VRNFIANGILYSNCKDIDLSDKGESVEISRKVLDLNAGIKVGKLMQPQPHEDPISSSAEYLTYSVNEGRLAQLLVDEN
jgi:hypothetical protein